MLIKEDSYRFINISLFMVAALVNSFPTQAFSAIAPIIQDVYNVSQFEVNMNNFIFPISYVFMLLPANYIIDKKGLKAGTLICEMAMIVGLAIRSLISVNFYLFHLGTLFCSLGFCFMISAANKFATIWFPKREIFVASTLCLLALYSSDGIGTFFSASMITEQSTKQDIQSFFLFQSLGIIAIQVAMMILFRGKPKSMQNFASEAQRSSYTQDLKNLWKNSNYMRLFFVNTLIYGATLSLYVMMPWMTNTYGYDAFETGMIMLCSNLAGIIGCLLFSHFMKMSYKRQCVIGLIGQITFTVLIFLFMQFQFPIFVLYICSGGIGFFGFPFLTTSTDFATQTAFPIGEATSGGCFLFGGNIFGVLISIVYTSFIDGQSVDNTRIGQIISLLLIVFGLSMMWFVKEDLNRSKYEQAKEEQEDITSQLTHPQESTDS